MKKESVSNILIWVLLSLFGAASIFKMIAVPDGDNFIGILLTGFCIFIYANNVYNGKIYLLPSMLIHSVNFFKLYYRR